MSVKFEFFADGQRVSESTRQAAAILSGPLAGVVVFFLVGMVTLDKGAVDPYLAVTLLCLGIALPFLLLALVVSLLNLPGRHAWFALGVGVGNMYVGLFAFFNHLSRLAAAGYAIAALVCVWWLLDVTRAERARRRAEARIAAQAADAAKVAQPQP